MRRRLATALLAVALVAACDKTGVPTRTVGAGARKSQAPAKLPAPTSAASEGATTAPSADPAGPDVLLAPTRAAIALSGRIALDASYAVGTGGVLLSNHGAGVVSNNAGGVLAVKGAQLLSNNSGNLVSRDAAGIFSHAAAGLTGKVKLISDHGAGVVSNNAGSLIANNGGGLTAKTKYGLLAAPAFRLLAEGAPGSAGAGLPHAAYPVAGMLVGVLSLADGAYLPLGVDRAGQSIYAVYTDAAGGFQVHLPESRAKNVLVVASVPGTDDPRLAVDLFAGAAPATGLVVDDASTVITGYLRSTIVGRLEEALDPDPCLPPPRKASASTHGFKAAIALYQDLFGDDFKRLPRAARQRVLARFTDVVLAHSDLASVPIDPMLTVYSEATGLAMATLVDILGKLERRAAEKLAAAPTYFDDKIYVTIANRERGSGPPYVIRKPSDLTGMVAKAYLASSDISRATRLQTILVELGLPPVMQLDLDVAGASLIAGAVPALGGEEADVRLRAAMRAAIAEEAQAATPAGDPSCIPIPSPPVLAAEVTTLAGAAEPGDADGPATDARFRAPGRLAYDPRGFLLVSEMAGHRIRRIDLNDPAHPVTTIAGTGQPGWLDGPAKAAQLNGPGGLALDAAGALWVADRGNHRIRKITAWDGPDARAVTVAGDGTAGFADGAGPVARFAAPIDLAFGPDGRLYVADALNRRVRAIAPDGAVTTVAGSGEDKTANGVGAAAAFQLPRGLAFAPDGHLYVADGNAGAIRRVTPAGAATLHAGERAIGQHNDGTLYTANFQGLGALALGPDGALVLADTDNQRIRLLDRDGFVSTIAGSGIGGAATGGFADGPGATAAFDAPEGVAVAKDGTIYVADARNHRIRALRLPAR